jgi:hypothetical protein
VELPGRAVASDVAADHNGTLHALGGGILFRERKPSEPENVAAGGAPVRPKAVAKPKPPVTPGGTKCPNNVVVLYGFTKVTPDDYDFPLTRKALKGHTELKDVTFAVTRDRGKKFLAALTPSFDTAKSVRTVIEKGVEGSKPQVVCATPELVRELKIDLRTGDVLK